MDLESRQRERDSGRFKGAFAVFLFPCLLEEHPGGGLLTGFAMRSDPFLVELFN